MRKILLLSLSFLMAVVAFAQDTRFTVELSTDSVLLGNYVQVTFTLENAKGTQFEPPAFEDFSVVSGPNTSSSFSMINGDVTQKISYTYYLEPKEIGSFYIAPASIEADETILETEPLEVMVFPNPEGIIQKPQSENRIEQNDMFRSFPRSDFFFDFNFPEMPEGTPEPKPQEQKKKKKRKTYKL